MITVIITTYKREPDILKRAIDSVISQTYTDWEIIIIDDSPSDYAFRDGIRDMVLGLKGNISYVRHDRNYGANRARNTGLKLAKGKYIAYLDDDDEFMPEKLEKQLAKFSDENIAMVYCGCLQVYDDTGRAVMSEIQCREGNIYAELMRRNFIGSNSFPLIRTEALREIGGFDEEIQAFQDWDMWLRLLKDNDVSCVNEPLVKYHIHGGEHIGGSLAKRIQGYERIYAKNKAYLAGDKYAECKRLVTLSGMYRKNGEYMKSFKLWLKALPLQPFRLWAHVKGEKL